MATKNLFRRACTRELILIQQDLHYNVNIKNKNLIIILAATGFYFTEFKAFFAASNPSRFGMLVWNDLISNVTRSVSFIIFSLSLILLMKSDVSFVYGGSVFQYGWR